MKIDFKFVTILSSIGVNFAEKTCSTSGLTKPEHWNGWACKSSDGSETQGLSDRDVDVGTKCRLQCPEGSIPWAGQRRNHYACRHNGWHPSKLLDLQCKLDRKLMIMS